VVDTVLEAKGQVVGCVAAMINVAENDTQLIAVTHQKYHGQSDYGNGAFWPCSHILNIAT